MFTGNKTIEDSLDLKSAHRIDEICDTFEDAWESGNQPKIESFLQRCSGLQRDALLSELVALEVQYRRDQGDLANPDEYLRRFPGCDDAIHAAFARGLSPEAFVDRLASVGLLERPDIASLRTSLSATPCPTADAMAHQLVTAGKLTEFQAETLCTGRPDPLVLGDYRVVDRLGVGGMGVVYEAYHARLGKRVALKVLRRESIADGHMLARFEREMKAVGQLNHPNIVAAHDAREDNGVHYLVMELVEGGDLARLVHQHGPFAIADACEAIRQAALGLQHAQEHKLVHRDIKPSNLMLTREGQTEHHSAVVKILDLGLARLDQELSAALTSAGQVMGTLDYMAPEQADNSNEVNIRADVYSLGATLYKLLVGAAPFEDLSHNTMVKKLNALANAAVPPIQQHRPDVPAELAAIVERMLAKDPQDRIATPAEVASILAPFCVGEVLGSLLDAPQVSQETAFVQSNVETAVKLNAASRDTTPSQASNAAMPCVQTIDLSPAAKHKRVPTLPRVLALAVGCAVVVAAIIAYRIQTNYGEVVVEIMDKSVAAQLTADGIDVIDKDDPENVWKVKFAAAGKPSDDKEIPAGTYGVAKLPGVTLEVTNSKGTNLSASEFKLTRGDNIRIRIRSDAVVSATVPPTSVSGTPATANCALRVQGSDESPGIDEWSVPSLVGLDPSQPFTVEARVRILKPGQGGLLSIGHHIGFSYTTSGLNDWPIKWRFNIANNAAALDHANWEYDDSYLGQTVHLAGVFHKGVPRLYVDGELIDTHLRKRLNGTNANEEIDPASAAPFDIKLAGGELNVFTGGSAANYIIDEIRISQAARYTENFQPVKRFEPDEYTLALYHLDEGTGDKLVDSSGHGHHGTIHQAIWVKQVAPDKFVSTDPDRAFAEWVLKRGGTLTLNSGSLEPKSVDDLPSQPFRVFSAVSDGNDTSDQDLARLEGLRLESLSLSNLPITGEGLSYIPTTVQYLTLYGCVNLEGRNLRHLVRLRSLIWLSLAESGGSISDEDLAVLTQLPNLERLSLPQATTRSGLRHVVQCPALWNLHVGATNLTATDIDILADAPNLTELVLKCGQLTPDWVAPLNRVKSLRTLAFDNDNNRVDVSALAKLTNVTTLRVNLGTLTDEDLTHLASMRQLRQLDIPTNLAVSEAGVRKLHQQLPDCRIVSRFGSFGPDYPQERKVAE